MQLTGALVKKDHHFDVLFLCPKHQVIKADFKYLFPYFMLVDFLLPALSICPGPNPAQEHKKAALGNCFFTSVPTSAIICSAIRVAMPEIESKRSISS